MGNCIREWGVRGIQIPSGEGDRVNIDPLDYRFDYRLPGGGTSEVSYACLCWYFESCAIWSLVKDIYNSCVSQ